MKKLISTIALLYGCLLQINIAHAQDKFEPQIDPAIIAPCLEANIIILNDKSSSMGSAEVRACLLMYPFLHNLPIDINHVWIGAATFGSSFQAFAPKYDYAEAEEQIICMCSSPSDQDATVLNENLFKLVEAFNQATLRRGKEVQNIVVIISDGVLIYPKPAEKTFSILKERFAIDVFAIGLTADIRGQEWLKTFASQKSYFTDGDADSVVQAILSRSICP
ncbi:MAG TPA: VWA domain-containing protein [Candidatus Paceibacterota bacterium]|nr:VWA domain-containing protein [Candidatus Paceibacterota bacterium]